MSRLLSEIGKHFVYYGDIVKRKLNKETCGGDITSGDWRRFAKIVYCIFVLSAQVLKMKCLDSGQETIRALNMINFQKRQTYRPRVRLR